MLYLQPLWLVLLQVLLVYLLLLMVGLYIRYQNKLHASGEPAKPGCLCFWFNPAGLATHIEMCIDDGHTIGASGGGSTTTTPEAAAQQNAFIKIRPLGYRGTNYKICDPFKE
jgi:hypothetical protein